MSVGLIDATRAATELSSFVGLKSDWLSLLAEQSNSNGGFLALVGLLLALLTLLAIIHPLRKICLVLAVLLIATTVAFLWPQEGQIIQPVIQAETTGRPAVPNATNEEEQRPTFRVTGVSCADVLNVRMQPGLFVEGAIIGTLSCNRYDITPLGPTTRIGFSEWWFIEADGTRGWVNSRYLRPAFENNPTRQLPSDTRQPAGPVSQTACVPITDVPLTRDRSNSHCLVSDLTVAELVRTYWTGTCDSSGQASGLGVLRTFDVKNGRMDLLSMFFGRVQSGAPLVGYLSLDGRLQAVCSQSNALRAATSRPVRQEAEAQAIAGLDQAISLFLAQQNTAVAKFYQQYKSQIERMP